MIRVGFDRMRDPLGRVPVRYKLSLTFLLTSATSLGVGGYVGYERLSRALVERIETHLEREAGFRAEAVSARIDACRDQTADFASDGLIRDLAAAALRDPAGEGPRRRLADHLASRKLGRIEGLLEVRVCGPDGRVLARAVSPGTEPPRLVLSADLPEGRVETVLGAEALCAVLPDAEAGPTAVRLLDAAGDVVFESGPGGGVEPLSARAPVHGWDGVVVVEISAAEALGPVAALRKELLGVGAALALATAILLYFPLRYTVWPLARLAECARRTLVEGRPVEVPVEGTDEIGELATALHRMSSGLLERTREASRQKDTLRAVLECMHEGVVFVDETGRIALANSANPLARHLAGPGDGWGEPRADLARDRLAGVVARAREAESAVEESDWGWEGRTYECSATPVRDSAHGRLGVVCVHRDVTDRRRAERRAARAERLAGIGRLASGIAHELGTPLGSIVFFCDEAAEELKTGHCGRCAGSNGILEMLASIQRQAYRCKEIGRRLLELSREEPPRIRPIELAPLLDEAVTIVGAARAERPEFRIEVDPRRRTIATDREKLLGALTAILENAADAGRRIDVRSRANGGSVVIEVADDGPGIPAAELGKIFEPFYTTKATGTGLGLSLADSKIRAVGGEIDVESRPGSGTTVRIAIPDPAESAP